MKTNTIIKSLTAKGVNEYLISDNITSSYQMFYVLGKLETVRKVNTHETRVVVYKRNEDTLGNSAFIISGELSKKELEKQIDDALYQASFVKNQPYELVKGEGKKSVKYKALDETPFNILENIAKIYNDLETKEARFNAVELFFDDEKETVINSNGVNYTKNSYEISIEAIPSFYSETFKSELYRMFKYSNVDYDKVKEDAVGAISDVKNRGIATKLPEGLNKANIILHDNDIKHLFDEFISPLSYGAKYQHSNLFEVGDDLQSGSKYKFNLYLDKTSKSEFFDEDGVLLNKTQLIKDGVAYSMFGTNRFASYLNVKPTGDLPKIVIDKGPKSFNDLTKKPYIEIFDLSGLQSDSFASYLGGEVRLALYHDGKNVYPISGFSFSTNLNEAIKNMIFSKETVNKQLYAGPKFMLIPDCDLI